MATKGHWYYLTDSIDASIREGFSNPSLNFYNQTTSSKASPPHFALIPPKLILTDSLPSSTDWII